MTLAIVPAAGKGLRFGGGKKKQFLPLAGAPVFIRTLGVFQNSPHIDRIVCVVPKEDLSEAKTAVALYALSKVVSVLPGGERRQDSVAAALAFLEKSAASDDIVLVHDGARPLVRPRLIAEIVEAVQSFGAAVAARRVTDSLKAVSLEGIVQKSLNRDRIWAMQTPQGFRFSILAAAYKKGADEDLAATDEAMLVERLGLPIHCIEGPADNMKITGADDLALAEFFLGRQNDSEIPRPSQGGLT